MRSWKRTSLRLAVALGVLASALAVPGMARAASLASISGAVTSQVGGHVVGGVEVALGLYTDEEPFGDIPELVATTTTDAHGHYQFTGLEPSDDAGYLVCFYTDATPADAYQDQCYKGQPWYPTEAPNSGIFGYGGFGDGISLAAGTHRPGINAALVRASEITGVVRSVKTGRPLGGAGVFTDGSGAYQQTFSTTTAANGRYRLKVPSSTTGYKVCFQGINASDGTVGSSFLNECYLGRPWPDQQDAPVTGTAAIRVKPEQVVLGIDADLTTRPTIIADSQTIHVGQDLPTLTYKLYGVGGQTFSEGPDCDVDYYVPDTVGTFTISCNGELNSGDAINTIQGTLTVLGD